MTALGTHPGPRASPGSVRPWARHTWDGFRDRGLALTVLSLTAGAVLAAMWAQAPAALVLTLAALPILVVLGARHALTVVPLVIVLRALVDNLGQQVITAGIAAALIGLALLVVWRSAAWLLVLVGTSGYLLLSAASGADAFGAVITYGATLRLLGAVAIVIIVANAPGKLTAIGIARSVQLVGIAPAGVALLQYVTGTGIYAEGILRASGTLAQANSAAVLFALCNVTSFALLMARAPRRALNLALFGVFLAAQLATGSVGGALTCLVMIIVHLLTLRSTRAERVVLSLLGIALVAYLAATSEVGSQRLGQYIGPNANPFSGANSLGWRFEAWAKVLDAWRVHPAFGNGIGATQAGVILDTIPHNEYVRLLAEMGVFGLGVVLVVCLGYGVRMLRALHRSTDFGPSLALAVLAGSLVNAIAANTMLYSVSFYTTVFILTGCWRISREHQREPVPTTSEAGGPG